MVFDPYASTDFAKVGDFDPIVRFRYNGETIRRCFNFYAIRPRRTTKEEKRIERIKKLKRILK